MTDCQAHGDGLVAFGFIKHLAERGHRVHVAVERSRISGSLPPGVVLHHIGRSDAPTNRAVFMYRMRRLFERLHPKERFDLIHQLNPVYSGVSLALVGTRVPVVLGTYVADWPRTTVASPVAAVRRWGADLLKRQIVALQQHRAAALLLTTPAAAERLAGGAAIARKAFMLSNGVDTARFTPSRLGDSSLKVVSLCGLARHKGAQVLLDAFAVVMRSVPGATLEIGGATSAEERAAVRGHPACASGKVTFAGGISREDLPNFLSGGSVFCMPSLGEPYGMAALEAMACGLPIVASDSGGLAYLVADGGGRKVPEGDPGALACALTQLLLDPVRRQRFGAYNRAAVVEHSSWPAVIQRLESIYATVLKETRRPLRRTIA